MNEKSPARVALVTGGFSGIGFAAATQLARDGVSVALGGRTVTTDRLNELSQSGSAVWGQKLDVRDPESVRKFVISVEERLGPVDILVNSAGIGTQQQVRDHDEQKWRDVIDTNLTGCFYMIRTCLPGMMERKWGRIVSVGSTAARTAMPGYAAYCASKSDLLGLTRAVALEGAAHGVSATMVSPTWVDTEMMNKSFAAKARTKQSSVAQEMHAYISESPQKRLVQPAEIGALIAFLCREESLGIT
ncbi:MAG: SDR family NAD(P)-dependent oxidoreductase, partial [Arenicellales bacterium]